MRRRALLALLAGTGAWSPLAWAQERAARLGLLIGDNTEQYRQPLVAALRERGYVEGANLSIEERIAGRSPDRLAAHAQELVNLGVDLVVAFQTPAVIAAKQATADLPIVFTAGDPVGTGLVASLARPGGNATGFSGITAELGGKRLEQLREIVPGARRIALLINARDPFTESFRGHLEPAARSMKLSLEPILLDTSDAIEVAFATLRERRPDAIVVQPSLPLARAATLALAQRLPAASEGRAFVAAGGLLSFAASRPERYHHIANYVDRILKGAKPADLPVIQATRYELILNLKTAAALGIAIPATILSRADEVIE